LQQSANITYYLITQFAGLIILAIVLIAFMLIIQKALHKLTRQSDNQTSDLLLINNKISEYQHVLVSVFTNVEKLNSDVNKLEQTLISIQQELSLLSSDYSDNQQVAEAIALARQGATNKIIVEKTGLSTEEADAVVRFHGNNDHPNK
jgi:uncharacterized membrane protein YhiD involved in acid resistance